MTSLCLLLLSGPAPLRLKFVQGAKLGYRITTEQASYSGGGTKPTEATRNEMPYQFQVMSSNEKEAALTIVIGPLVVNGRSVGRSRTTRQLVDANGSTQGRAPANFFVCLPSGGAKVGQTWKAPFFAGPPLPAGQQAVYKYSGISPDKRYAMVSLQVKSTGAGQVTGNGALLLRLSDGFLDRGSARFETTFMRPDQKDRTKMVVGSRVVLKYTISAS